MDPQATRHHRLTANLAAAGLLLALGAGFVAWKQPWRAASDAAPGATVPDDARALLIEQSQALTNATTKVSSEHAAGESRAAHSVGAALWSARRQLAVKNPAFTYRSGGDVPDRADGSTSARVAVSWNGGSSEVTFRLRPRSDGFDLMRIEPYGTRRLPVWLAGRLRVQEVSGARVITVDGGDPHVDAAKLTRVAVRAVHRIVPGTVHQLTVVAPPTPAIAAALLGRRSREIAQVAAVSTVLGGSKGDPGIVLNPTLFSSMDARARQIVMTHEATHVLTGVVHRDVTLWVAEGFADYVALHDDKAPLSTSAGQILRQVRAHGAPKALPSADEFDESAHGLGASYEAAWLAFRMLGHRYGDAAVDTFYSGVVDGASVDDAARRAFGVSVAEITADWRRYLTKSASTVS